MAAQYIKMDSSDDMLDENEGLVYDSNVNNKYSGSHSIWSRLQAMMPFGQRRVKMNFDDSAPGLGPYQRSTRKKNRTCRLVIVSITVLVIFVAALNYGRGRISKSADRGSTFRADWANPQRILNNTYEYPSTFTTGVKPLSCNSHNDEQHNVPLFEALHYGCISVEADMHLRDGDLLIGHDEAELNPERTLQTMYIGPLLHALRRRSFVAKDSILTRAGVFDEDLNQSLMLLIDFKASQEAALPIVQAQLQELRDGNYLTYGNGTHIIQGPITIIATGSVSFASIAAESSHRDIFFDAPLALIHHDHLAEMEVHDSKVDDHTLEMDDHDTGMTDHVPGMTHPEAEIKPKLRTSGQGMTGIEDITSAADFKSWNSQLASTSFKAVFGWSSMVFSQRKAQVEQVDEMIQVAHSQGLKVRFWGTPDWPFQRLRDNMWRELTRLGADIINVDDLEDFARGDWREKE